MFHTWVAVPDFSLELWKNSAQAWIRGQGETGDFSRREILDPCMKALLGDIKGAELLDLGCGEGRFSRWMRDAGAFCVGVDPVEEFVLHARKTDPEGTYLVAPAEDLPFGPGSFDLVVSYLTLPDIPDLDAAAEQITSVLRPGGRFVVATISNLASCTNGWVKDDQGTKVHRIIDRYMEHFSLVHEWSGLKIANFHRPLSYTLDCFLSRGMLLTDFLEPLPVNPGVAYDEEFRVPTFQVFQLVLQQAKLSQ